LGDSRWVIAGGIIEAIVLAIVGVAAQKPGAIPNGDSLRMNSERLGDLFHCQHACSPETIIARSEPIAPLNAGDDARREWKAFPGVRTLLVQFRRDFWIRVVVQ
jgi:hypothetical protein